jgi:hypothetical protein
MVSLVRLVWEALFLSEEPYAEMREGSNPALRGLGLVVLVALAVALVGLVGTTLEWATTPDMDAVQRVVLEGMQKMDWYRDMQDVPKALSEFEKWYDMGWDFFPALFGAPNVGSAALRIILLPLGLAVAWFLYAVVAYLFARLFGGEGSLSQTLGCTALAVAPQLLNLAGFFPYLVVGGVVGTWALLSRYVALKTCHRLNWSRTLAATLLPYVAFGLLISFFLCLGSLVLGLVLGGGAS